MYDYERMKRELATGRGLKTLLYVFAAIKPVVDRYGVVTMGEVLSLVSTGDNWLRMACVDRLVELGVLREVSEFGCLGQDRRFVAN